MPFLQLPTSAYAGQTLLPRVVENVTTLHFMRSSPAHVGGTKRHVSPDETTESLRKRQRYTTVIP